jgi:hypothetical protein
LTIFALGQKTFKYYMAEELQEQLLASEEELTRREEALAA